MAVSGVTTFKSSMTEILEDALSLLGVLAEEEPLQAYELERGLRVATKMLKAWQVDGVGGWHYSEGSLTLVDDTASYLFGSGGAFTTVPFEIMQVRTSHDAGPEYDLRRMSREEYYRMPLRTNGGRPTSFFYDRQRDSGTLYLWPVPDDSDHDITFTYRRRIMDMVAGPDNFDLPPEWEDAITKNLAYELIVPYSKAGTPIAAKVEVDARTSYAMVKAFDVAENVGTVSILPDDDYFYGWPV